MIQRRPKRTEEPPKATMADCLTGAPPEDIDAEKALIGSVLANCSILDEMALVVDAGDFFDEQHATIWRTMVAMHDKTRKVDAVTLAGALKQAGAYDQVGGAAAIVRLAQATPSWHHATFYATAVRKQSVKRQLLVAASDTVRDCTSDQFDPDECLERHEARVLGIGDKEVGKESVDAKQLMHSAMDLIDARRSNFGEATVQTGFLELDGLLGGLRPGQLLIVAARPSVGKTSFALNVAENIAIDNGGKVLFASLEMSSEELGERLLSSQSGITCSKLRSGSLSGDDSGDLVAASAKIAKAALHVIDDASISVRKIGAHARRVKRKHGLDVLIIDYLQLIDPADHYVQREQQVSTMTRSLKVLARELAIPIVCLAQLNRQAEASGNNNRPKLSHLRESGAIEQDADVVLFVHREEVFAPEKTELKGLAEIIVAKQRNGPVGSAKLVWRSHVMRFENRAPNRNADLDNYNNRSEDTF
jgi:replicative DNA helicase